ncbi:peptidoglycan-binding protein [Priestia aryabhattai]|uniref:peptidoglycan-binding protein n=1 Tax=Priestia aryabhattai TaxID=412384 RepID=UPI0015F69880|nr:peptidoglycan-binding protein [Priestia aryabhattai]
MAVSLQYLLDRSELKLKGVHGTIRDMSLELIKKAYNQKIYVVITQGFRSIAEQNALYAQGRTTGGSVVTNARGGYSFHNYGLAVDFVLLNESKQPVWNVNDKWMSVVRMATGMGFSSGAYWSSFKDYPHLELTFGLSLAQLRSGKKPPIYKGSTTPIENPSNSNSSDLRFNSRGDTVKKLQQDLTKLGYKLDADGIYGSATESKVSSFQKNNGLTVTGIADTKTLSKVSSLLAKLTPPVSSFVKPPKLATKEDYFKYILPYANTASKGTDIPFEVIMAQWAKESAYGNSDLVQSSNNYAGVTYVSNSIADFQKGRFSGYNTVDKFVQDYIRVMKLPYYDKVRAATTIEMTCIELGKSPYSANDPTYGTIIFQLVTKNNLSRFGADVIPDPVPTPTVPPVATKPEEMPIVTSLGSSFMVRAKNDLVVYKNPDLTEKLRTIGKGAIFAIYGYSENQIAYVAGGSVYVRSVDVEPVVTTVVTGGLSPSAEASFRKFLSDNRINGQIQFYGETGGNPAGVVTTSGLPLVYLKRWLEQMNFYYVAKNEQ